MTHRYFTLTVALEKDIRDDDAQSLIDAIRMIRGVLSVKGNVTNPDIWMAEERARNELRMKLFSILNPK